ncbi:GNAT family N-acetyltransferase [Kineococcus sp. TBRC 1896]|uniref:GNAT family N-acetyltransferase n=1 Tax=Kineococcus mangrovi TaxID=1660183 RepID=A0ABV4I5A2_9ACTN
MSTSSATATSAATPARPQEGTPRDRWPEDLFYRGDYHDLHAADRPSLYCRWDAGGLDVGAIHFGEVGAGVWRSPARGTFAGLAWRADRPLHEASEFVRVVETRLRDRGARRLEVVLPPLGHDLQRVSDQVQVLSELGWGVARTEVDEIIPVDEVPLETRMERGNAKRLRKCRRDGFHAAVLEPDELPSVYSTLVASRVARGWRLSMDLPRMHDMQRLYPDRVVLFGVRAGDQLAASAFCLRLSERVLYVFAWGHLPVFHAWSPVVALAEAIHDHCRAAGVQHLDLGTCPSDQPGLVRFKRGLGASGSLKVTMAKDLT